MKFFKEGAELVLVSKADWEAALTLLAGSKEGTELLKRLKGEGYDPQQERDPTGPSS